MSELNDLTNRKFAVTKGQTSVVVTAGAYTAVDVVGGLLEFDVSSGGGGGRITDIYLTDAANQAVAFTLYIFDDEPTAIADNGAWATGIDIDDLDNMIRKVDLAATDYLSAINTLRWAHVPNIDQDFQTIRGKLWMYAVCVSGPTYAATTDIKISATILLN